MFQGRWCWIRWSTLEAGPDTVWKLTHVGFCWGCQLVPGVGRAVARTPPSAWASSQHGYWGPAWVHQLRCRFSLLGGRLWVVYSTTWVHRDRSPIYRQLESQPSYFPLQYIKDFYRFREGQVYSSKDVLKKKKNKKKTIFWKDKKVIGIIWIWKRILLCVSLEHSIKQVTRRDDNTSPRAAHSGHQRYS